MDKIAIHKNVNASPRKVCDENKENEIRVKTFLAKVNSSKAVPEDWLHGFK